MRIACSALLRITGDEAILETGDGRKLTYGHGGLDSSARHLLWRLEQVRAGRATSAEDSSAHDDSPGELGRRQDSALRDVGRMLGHRFLGEAMAHALANDLAAARAARVSLRVALEVSGADLVNLPWETITLHGHDLPLILSDSVELYRSLTGLAATVTPVIPGPLRILVVIASPEHGGGELLDYEAELSRILDAVEPARRRDTGQVRHGGKAYVRVLDWGSRDAVRRALVTERFHVLHVTCHAAAGKLVLESEDGRPDRVDAKAFASDLLVPDRDVPLVVLAACSTAKATPLTGGPLPGTEWRGMAQDLLTRGVPAVLAMTAPVTDHYATELLSVFYAELAGRRVNEPLAALAGARRAVEQARAALPANDPRAGLSEWATPTLFLRGPSCSLVSQGADTEPIEESPQPVFVEEMVIRGVDHFVGRRAELRRLLRVLRSSAPAVMIHGLGGVGKSTLAARLVIALGESAGVVVSLRGTATVDQIMLALADRVSSWCSAHDIAHGDARYQLVGALRDGHRSWKRRLAAVAEHLLPTAPVTLVLDDFEDNLITADTRPHHTLADDSLAEFVQIWLTLPRSPLIITSRYPFTIPGDDGQRWYRHHLGPLSPAESRKLVWRLPALDALTAEERRRATADVGGHPRTLEYLDALLRAGSAQFPDVAERMEKHLRRRGITDPQAWFAQVAAADFDSQLAETIAAAADDILLTDLLTCLDTVPLARRLLVGATVYRQPLDETGLMRLVADNDPEHDDPQWRAKAKDLSRRMATGTPDWRALGSNQRPDPDELAQARRALEELQRHFEDVRRPRQAPSGFPSAMAALVDLGLLTPIQDRDGTHVAYHMHRWTATALARLVTPDELAHAHQQAVDDYLIRVFPLSGALDFSLDNLSRVIYQMEAAFHLIQLDKPAEDLLMDALHRLHDWGKWDWEERVCQDTIAHVPERTELEATLHRRLGVIAFDRGEYPAAERRYRQALAIDGALGIEAGRALDLYELGMIAANRRDWPQAEEHYRTALQGFTALGQEHNLASTYTALGITAFDQGKHAEAENWYQKCIAVAERTKNRSLLANAYGELGIIARHRGDYPIAERWCRYSMNLKASIGDGLGYARGLGELALLAKKQGNYAAAREQFDRALATFQLLGNRAAVGLTYANLGDLARTTQDDTSAEHWYTEAVAIAHDLGDPQAALLYLTLIELAVQRKDNGAGEKWARRLVDLQSQLGGTLKLAQACRLAAHFCTVNGDVLGAIAYTVRGLKSLPADTPPREEDLELPRSLRSAWGDDQFRHVLAQLLPAADAKQLLAALNDQGRQPQQNRSNPITQPPPGP